jgi:hypothetical protein
LDANASAKSKQEAIALTSKTKMYVTIPLENWVEDYSDDDDDDEEIGVSESYTTKAGPSKSTPL